MAQQLVDWFAGVSARELMVAFSGGVDSAVVACAVSKYCSRSDGEGVRVTLVTGRSPSLSTREHDDAMEVGKFLGLPHQYLDTAEMEDADYVRNDARRCYHCKKHLFTAMQELVDHASAAQAVLLSGTNADDLGDYRPGLVAASEAAVRAPLAELGIGKEQVYELARFWNLPISEKPPSPCLASRIAYGVEVSDERLRMIEQAEAYLAKLGIEDCRVRLHAGDMARIEVPLAAIGDIVSVMHHRELVDRFKVLGFRCVTLDLEGLRSGSLNQLVGISLPKDGATPG